MVFTAAEGADLVPQPGGEPFDQPATPDPDAADFNPAATPIWHWTPASGQPNKIDAVSCIARGMGMGRFLVCDSISFERVFVSVTKTDPPIEIPLTDAFLVRQFHLNEGRILANRHRIWPLAAEVDKSLLYVFAYEFPDGPTADPVVVPDAALARDDFMPPPQAANALDRSAGSGQRLTATATPLRVLVFLSLVCCKENNDFDPGGLLGGGRMVPHLMIMANRATRSVFGEVHVHRPANHTMLEGSDHSHHTFMNNAIENGVWADNNDAPGVFGVLPIPSPFWDDLFDAYITNLSFGLFNVVRPSFGARTINGAVEDLDDTPGILPGVSRSYTPRRIRRVARQGAFDNIHQAPTMKSSVKPAGPPYNLDRVTMAPFCEHDCLHTHWRWGEYTTQTSNLGWAAPAATAEIIPGTPYAATGAPMVPHNQEVILRIPDPHSFEYRVHAQGWSPSSKDPIPAGTYTVINHHGSAYALSVDQAMFLAAKVAVDLATNAMQEPFVGSAAATSNSAILYWMLRFGGVGGALLIDDIVQERLKTVDPAKVRDL
jgi:hypothetical protein